MTTTIDNKNAPVTAGAEGGVGEKFPLDGQSNYTTELTLRALELLQKTLPPDVFEPMMRTYQHKLQERLSGSGDEQDVNTEALLPPLRTIPSWKIMQTDYPESIWVVKNYLVSGIWFLYGKPKVGKSWLAGQLALAVAAGGKVFDKDVKQGKVLYLALEDGERRLKKRMRLQHWTENALRHIDYMLPKDFRDQIGYLNSGGGKRLLAHIERQDYLLTIVDTFSRAVNLNQLKSELMTDALSPFQEFAQAKNRVIVFVDHEPKRNEEGESAITALYGGIAKAGVADGVWRLYKERGKGARLDIEGRDLEDAYSLKLRFDRSLCYWYSEGDAETIEITERRREILDALANLGKCTLSQLEDATGQLKGNLHARLQDLVTEGLVVRYKNGNNVLYELREDG